MKHCPPQLGLFQISEGCWPWTGKLDKSGYGIYGKGRNRLGHRWAYGFFRGPVDDTKDLDHLCENRWCVNPWHLEPVDRGENNRRAKITHAWKAQISRWYETGRWESANAGAQRRAKQRRVEVEG